MVDYRDILLEVLVPEDRLQARIAELGAQVSADYAGQDLLLVCILRGGVMFLTDLMRHITTPHAIDFMAISSYGVGMRESTGNIRIGLDLQQNIENRHVLSEDPSFYVQNACVTDSSLARQLWVVRGGSVS